MKGLLVGELFTGDSTSAGRELVVVRGVAGSVVSSRWRSSSSWVGGPSPGVMSLRRGRPRHRRRGGLGYGVAGSGWQGGGRLH
ncbi:hypothetical protein TIFTF001_000890 [Ficus carica]|uniref:Uncharacterized protein n=1 Tax=Ficus carica TaxID=3494 RepID=A0AA88D2U3_FICCA|nr:hypothetical protein TIFTF001_000890 [Ficus carica]